MLRPLRFHRLCLERFEKTGGKDQNAPNNSGMKYGMRFPRNTKEADQFYKENGNLLWQNAILKELEALMYMKIFKKLRLSLRKARSKGFQFTTLRMIFEVKVDLRRKARLFIEGHVIDSSRHEVYASTMKSVPARILKTIAAVNNLYVMTGDIGNAYLNDNNEDKIYTRAGPKFEVVGIMAEENLLEVIKALHGLPTSGNRWHAHLSHTLREMGFKPTRFDPDVWIRGGEGSYDYIGTHTDYVLVVAVEPTSIFENLKETYTIKAFSPPLVHLG